MQAFEDYILAHPELMSASVWRWPVLLGTACFMAMALVLVFRTGKSREFLWSSAEGKFYRLSWLVAILAAGVQAHATWNYPEQKLPSHDNLFFGLGGLWFLLFCISMVLATSKAIRGQRAKKSETLEADSVQ